jgi:hypothetical protein
MLYLRSRWYEPSTGRFISPDTIVPNYYNPQSINRYVYVLNSPVNYTDPSGYIPQPPPPSPLPYDITSFELGWLWLTEQCPDHIVFDDRYDLTQDLMDDQGVNQARSQFYQRLQTGILENGTDDTYSYKYTVIPYIGAAVEYVTGHDQIGFFLGSYGVSSHLNPDKTVTINVSDSKNWESGTRSPFYYIPDYLGPIINPCLPEPYSLHRSRHHSLEGLIMGYYQFDFPSDIFLASVLENRRRSDPGFFGSDIRLGGRIELVFTWKEPLQTY